MELDQRRQSAESTLAALTQEAAQRREDAEDMACSGTGVASGGFGLPDPAFGSPDGVFYFNSGTNLAQIVDGSSNTILMSETIIGSGAASSTTPSGDSRPAAESGHDPHDPPYTHGSLRVTVGVPAWPLRPPEEQDGATMDG